MASNPFESRKLPQSQIDKIAEARVEYQVLYTFIIGKIPESRERSLAITKLEESAMWLNKGLSLE